MRSMVSLTVSGMALALALSACSPSKDAEPKPVTTERLLNAAAEPENWLTHGGTYPQMQAVCSGLHPQRNSALDCP